MQADDKLLGHHGAVPAVVLSCDHEDVANAPKHLCRTKIKCSPKYLTNSVISVAHAKYIHRLPFV